MLLPAFFIGPRGLPVARDLIACGTGSRQVKGSVVWAVAPLRLEQLANERGRIGVRIHGVRQSESLRGFGRQPPKEVHGREQRGADLVLVVTRERTPELVYRPRIGPLLEEAAGMPRVDRGIERVGVPLERAQQESLHVAVDRRLGGEELAAPELLRRPHGVVPEVARQLLERLLRRWRPGAGGAGLAASRRESRPSLSTRIRMPRRTTSSISASPDSRSNSSSPTIEKSTSTPSS